VTFNLSTQNLLQIRASLGQRRMTLAELNQIPIEVGLMDEAGYPHRGFVDYVSPNIDASTGTTLVQGKFDNADRTLLPGFFVRIRIPMERKEQNALLVPNRAFGQNQEGSYVLVLNSDDTVAQRKVEAGEQFGELRVVESGLQPDDRVVVTGNARAIPGRKVQPETVKLAPPAGTSTASPK
jgi:RND family efflux transporter MFP subunit